MTADEGESVFLECQECLTGYVGIESSGETFRCEDLTNYRPATRGEADRAIASASSVGRPPKLDGALLLVVEDTFELTSNSGLTLTPHITQAIDPGDYPVVAISPDGHRKSTTANVSRVHFSPGGFQLVCRLPGLSKLDILPGTQIRHC